MSNNQEVYAPRERTIIFQIGNLAFREDNSTQRHKPDRN